MDKGMTYDDFLRSLSIKDILVDAGYTLNKRDGLRYPSYVRYGSDGTRIRGDKFIVRLTERVMDSMNDMLPLAPIYDMSCEPDESAVDMVAQALLGGR